ncbi:MAG: Thiamine-monophosphate kinase [Solimicrobium sp.]|jgi:thiamine-monophosphate kinase|nr:Thiamine-monophosphate kinase [Solimicrobium sp.]
MTEFEVIQRYFTNRQLLQCGVDLSIGDDCALFSPRAGTQLAISSDMLVEGRHFFSDANARMLGHKSLAVNLSDLAAMGAEPRAFTLALALPEVQPVWLRDFSDGLFELADHYHCQLIGGDTTKGPLNICITVFGEVPNGQALRRDTAREGDDIWVSGTLGDARLALASYLTTDANQHSDLCTMSEIQKQQAALHLHMPSPRIALGMALRGVARAAIDVSDGLIGDLNHILERSKSGATVWCDALPFGATLSHQNVSVQREFALAGGDDYELCFTASKDQRNVVLAAAKQAATQVTRIGYIESEKGLRLRDANNLPVNLSIHSFDHFYEPGN